MIIDKETLDALEIDLVKCRRCNARPVIDVTDAIVVDRACNYYRIYCSNDKCPSMPKNTFFCVVNAELSGAVILHSQKDVLGSLEERWNACNFAFMGWWISLMTPIGSSLTEKQINHLGKKHKQLQQAYIVNKWDEKRGC